MNREDGTVGRRAVLRGGLATAVTLLAAACSPSTDQGSSGGHPAKPEPHSTAGAPTSSPSASASARPEPAILRTPGPDVAHGPRSRPVASLTFHGAGDPGLAREVLRICADRRARITVFAVGTWLTGNPDIGRAIVAAGHDLGNHTWSHQPMLRLDRSAADAEIRDGARAVAAIKGSSALLFRLSGTQHSTALLRSAALAAGYSRCISYDVDPMDYQDPGAAKVTSRTLESVRPGSIVSLHLGHRGTVEALPAILEGLATRGLTTRTVTELLA